MEVCSLKRGVFLATVARCLLKGGHLIVGIFSVFLFRVFTLWYKAHLGICCCDLELYKYHLIKLILGLGLLCLLSYTNITCVLFSMLTITFSTNTGQGLSSEQLGHIAQQTWFCMAVYLIAAKIFCRISKNSDLMAKQKASRCLGNLEQSVQWMSS